MGLPSAAQNSKSPATISSSVGLKRMRPFTRGSRAWLIAILVPNDQPTTHNSLTFTTSKQLRIIASTSYFSALPLS